MRTLEIEQLRNVGGGKGMVCPVIMWPYEACPDASASSSDFGKQLK
jgi:hypothetical protein